MIDLTRLPAHGREVGAALRDTKATRFILLVFVGGEAEKVARVLGLSSRQSRGEVAFYFLTDEGDVLELDRARPKYRCKRFAPPGKIGYSYLLSLSNFGKYYASQWS